MRSEHLIEDVYGDGIHSVVDRDEQDAVRGGGISILLVALIRMVLPLKLCIVVI